jgi:hypothetical protein
MQVVVRNVRITFPKLFSGQEEQFNNAGDPYWSASFLLDRDHPDLPALKAAIAEAAKEKWPQQADAMLKQFFAKDKLPVHDGDLKASKPYGAAYAGMLYISARNNAKSGEAPRVFAAELDPSTKERRKVTSANDAHAPYSGAFVDVKLNLFGYNQGGGQGVGASISGIAVRPGPDGKPFGERLSGGAPAAASDFEKIPELPASATKSAADLF